MRNLGVFLLLAFLFLLVARPFPALQCASAYAASNVIRVPSDYPTIQQAVDAALRGDTVLVGNGTYHEHVLINKTLSLVGEDRTNTVIDTEEGAVEPNFDSGTIKVTADDVLITGFTIQNSSSSGIYINNSNNCTISGNIITHNSHGITVDHSNGTTVQGNIVSSNGGAVPGLTWGQNVLIIHSCNDTITDNVLTSAIVCGLAVEDSNNNSIRRNLIEENPQGTILLFSNLNAIYQNSLVGNGPSDPQALQINSQNNSWDDGSRGNYWDDYIGLDDGSGGRAAGDGVGDTGLPEWGLDYYPLICPPMPIQVLVKNTAYPVSLVSNSTVSTFRFTLSQASITFNLMGPADAGGFFNLTIPAALLRGDPWDVLVNNKDVRSQSIMTSNDTCTSIYFTYNQSTTQTVIVTGTWVVPEFPPTSIVFLAMILAVVSFGVCPRRNRRQKPRKPARNVCQTYPACYAVES